MSAARDVLDVLEEGSKTMAGLPDFQPHTETSMRIQRLQNKIARRDQKIVGLKRRVEKLEAALAMRTGDAVVVNAAELRRDMEKAVTRALCNVRMIPVLGIGAGQKIVDVKVSDA